MPAAVERMLRGYLAARRPGEPFADFANRHEIEALRGLFRLAAAPAA